MQVMLRFLRVHSHITTLFAMNSLALDVLTTKWDVPSHKVELLPYQVDVDFFDPQWCDPPQASRPQIVAVGRERRDYATFTAAVAGLDVDVTIAVGSQWARSETDKWANQLPANVAITSVNYAELRDLYAASALCVIPLRETDLQNGITAIQEAMSMAKPVVVTRTRGQGDLVADDQLILRDGSGRSTAGYFARYFAPADSDLHGPTGLYVAPGDVSGMRNAIERLLSNPELIIDMGARGRRVCQEIVSLDRFLDRVRVAVQPYCS